MRLSIVIPTLNSGKTLSECLQSLVIQDYPRSEYEIILADGGSTDSTLAIAAGFGVDKVVPNSLQTGEAGKTEGIRVARGDVIALIDSDNILDTPDWLTRMMKPFDDPEIVAAEPLAYTWRRTDPSLTRYFAMLGMNDPLCLFVGNYDRYSGVTGRWTGLPVAQEPHAGYFKVTLDPANMPTIGANGFLVRRSALDKVEWQPYYMDVDVMYQLVVTGYRKIAKVEGGIVHLYCKTFEAFRRKQDRRVRDYFYFSARGQKAFPWQQGRTRGIFLYVLAAVTVVPLMIQVLCGLSRRRDAAWFWHFPVIWATLCVYGFAVIRQALGIKPAMKERTRWGK